MLTIEAHTLGAYAAPDHASKVAHARALLAAIARDHQRPALATSLGAEDMVLLDLIATDRLAIDVFMLDTGRLPHATLELLERAHARYAVPIRIFAPAPDAVAAYVERHGMNGFYASVEARKACCHVRKVVPLAAALEGRDAWITGLRRAQAVSRSDVAESAFDPLHGLSKFSPLADWDDADVWRYVREHRVPYNTLHDRGYPSIGCEPCTRAVRPGEHPRAGRWWWEQEGAHKECGLHSIPIVEKP